MLFGKEPDQEISIFEKWLINKVFMPIGLVFFICSLYSCVQEHRECKQFCSIHGYKSYKFYPNSYLFRRSMQPNQCECRNPDE